MKLFLLFAFILSCSDVFAQKPLIKGGYVKTKYGGTLTEVLHRQVRLPKSLIYKKGFLDSIIRFNPQINPKKITAGTKLYIEIPYDTKFVKPSSIKVTKGQKTPNHNKVAKEKNVKKVVKKINGAKKRKFVKRAKHQKKLPPPTNRFNLFYTSSIGSFSEEVKGVTAKSEQNSPGSVGVGYNHNFNKTYSLSNSLYLSYLESTTSAINEKQTEIPLEYGLTSHLNFKTFNYFWPYVGFDYESFSTFNTDEVIEGEEFATREHQLLYLSFGLSARFAIFGQVFYNKLGLSQSLYSKSSRKSLFSDEEFSGQKAMLFVSTKVYKNLSTHLLHKEHFLTGPTDLRVSRTGFGVSLSF